MSEHEMTDQEYQEILNSLIKKENNLLLFTKNDKKIFILGTIHHFHFTANDYSLAHVESVIKTVAPNVLLIEGRQATLSSHDAVDGPFEMAFARCIAREQGLPVFGIDSWEVIKDKAAFESLDALRDDRMFDNIIAASEGYCCALVLMGASHRERMPERFLKAGYFAGKIDNVLDYFSNINTPFRYPNGMSAEFIRSCEYYKTGFLEEVNKSISPGDELYEMFEEMTKPGDDYDKKLEMITKNNLFY